MRCHPARGRGTLAEVLRAILVVTAIAVGLRYSLKSPFHALLFYLWLAYFRPESWVWFDFVSQLNLSWIVGIWVILYTLVSEDRLWLGWGPLLLMAVLAQSFVSTLESPVFVSSFPVWREFAKVLVMSYVMMVLITNEERLRSTMWLIAASLGFEGAKQGWAQLVLNPGAQNNNGWVSLGNNNQVAIGMLIIFSFILALIDTPTKKFERNIWIFVAIGVFYRALSTYSRGAFLACAALFLQYLSRSSHKIIKTLVVVSVALIVLQVLPDSFWDRMGTIQTAAEGEEVDSSASGRLHFWQVARQMAADRPLTGFGVYGFSAVYDSYDTSNGAYGSARAVHSMWFGLLAELGYPGLLLGVIIIGYAFIACRRARRAAVSWPGLARVARFAAGLEGAILVIVVAGTFSNIQYHEIVWHSLALAMIVDRLVSQHVKSERIPLAATGLGTQGALGEVVRTA